MTKITKNEKTVLSAYLGGTNLGMKAPDRDKVQEVLNGNYSLESAVIRFWSGYMESDEMMEMFLTECKWWFKDNLKDKTGPYTRERISQIWPDHAAKFF